LMTIGVAPGSPFALMIAPRKLQSLAATVQPDAPATSSVRSTSNIVASKGDNAAVPLIARVRAKYSDDDEAVCVKLIKLANMRTSVKTDAATFLFMAVLPM
jgi:hypothetical protein